jgi:hypothetical protein
MKDSQEKQIKFIDPIDKLTTCAAFNKICILPKWLLVYKKSKRIKWEKDQSEKNQTKEW